MFLAMSADDDYKRSVIGVFFLERNYSAVQLINVMVSKLIRKNRWCATYHKMLLLVQVFE